MPLTGCLPVKFSKPTGYLLPTQYGLQASIPQRERKTVTVAAIYTRVSSDKQREKNTIASQTTALIDFARSRGHHVPDEWIFEDDGYSGATLIRPGLERVRDLAAEGQIHAVLVHAPDRLSRKYAYQVLLIEEFARHGVETIFLKAPQTPTAEDHLLVQFQGMIAEYERAQILERSRRGKRHCAHQGQVSVLSGAPYGYHYVRRSDDAAAYYEVIEAEADVVRMVYNNYVSQGLSIGAITRLLNEQGVPTRKQTSRWERSTVWAMLRNPAYKGTACFGKTQSRSRQRITRPLRQRGGVSARDSANHEKPCGDWIEIAVPALIDDDVFAHAAETLEQNKIHAARRTIKPSTVQGLVACRKCGYAMSRTSTRSSARTIHYYRCIGSDAWRHLGSQVCQNRPVRQDLLDHLVWTEIVRLLEDPRLIQDELDRRLAAARTADPMQQREKTVQRDLTQIRKSMDRLLTAYQEDLLSIDELRRRMPELRQREQAMQTALQSLVEQVNDRAIYLRLAETLSSFLTRLRASADTLDVQERQRIVRLLVRDILVDEDTIVIRHSIPVPSAPPTDRGSSSPPSGTETPAGPSYLLRTGRQRTTLRGSCRCWFPCAQFHGAGRQPAPDYGGEHRQPRQQGSMPDVVEAAGDVRIEHPFTCPGRRQGCVKGDNCVHRAPPRPEPIAVRLEARLPFGFQRHLDEHLQGSIPDCGDAQGPLSAVRFWNVDPSDRLWSIALETQISGQFHPALGRPAHHAVDPGRIAACVLLGHPADRKPFCGC
jgi:site-specific DNA recombinase